MMVKTHKSFGFMDFIWRWVGSLVLVFVSYNPSGHSYLHWVRESVSDDTLGALQFFVGAVLVAGWAIFLVATGNSLGKVGAFIAAAMIGTALWLLAQIGLVSAETTRSLVWLALFALATLLAIGLSWSHIWRRLSGQLEVDDN